MEYNCIHNHQSQFLEMTRTADRHPIGQLCDIFGGATPARTNKEYWENGTCPWFTVEDLHNQGAHIWKTEQHITEAALKKVKKYPVDTVLLCCTSATIGSVAYSHIPLSSNQQFNGLVVKDRNKLRPEFLFYNCTLLKDELLKQCGKTTFAFVPRGTLEKIEIFCPDIHVQNQFVKVLEQADKSKFDGFKSQFLEMFGNSEIIELGNVATFINGSAFKPEEWASDGLPIIRIQNLTDPSASYNYYSGTDAKVLIESGDVLVSWSATLDVYLWNQGKAVLNQHIFKVVFDKIGIDKDFFIYTVKSKLAEMVSKAHGSTMKHIVKKDFETTLVPYPSFEKQKEFASIVRQSDKSKYYVQNKQNYICHILTNQIQ